MHTHDTHDCACTHIICGQFAPALMALNKASMLFSFIALLQAATASVFGLPTADTEEHYTKFSSNPGWFTRR